jgi:hypothetical protein
MHSTRMHDELFPALGQVPPAEGYSEGPSILVQRNGFLRLEEENGGHVDAAAAEEEGYATKWQLLRTQPTGRL